jgi:Skp family chaperone for outer membrane proteins
MLKRAACTLLCAVLVMAACAPPARAALPLRIAYFDTETAFAEISAAAFVQQANAEFNAWLKGINTGMEKRQKELAELRNQVKILRAKGEDGEASTLEEELAGKQSSFEEDFQKNAQAIAARRLEVRDILEDQMLYLIREIAEERGYLLVFEKRYQMILYHPEDDLTAEVARRHRLRFASMESPFATGVPAELTAALDMPVSKGSAVEAYDMRTGRALSPAERRLASAMPSRDLRIEDIAKSPEAPAPGKDAAPAPDSKDEKSSRRAQKQAPPLKEAPQKPDEWNPVAVEEKTESAASPPKQEKPAPAPAAAPAETTKTTPAFGASSAPETPPQAPDTKTEPSESTPSAGTGENRKAKAPPAKEEKRKRNKAPKGKETPAVPEQLSAQPAEAGPPAPQQKPAPPVSREGQAEKTPQPRVETPPALSEKPSPAVEREKKESAPAPQKIELPPLYALGMRTLKQGDQGKAMRMWNEMLTRIEGPLYAVASQPLCGPVNLAYHIERAGRPETFGLEAGEGCLRVVLSLHRSREEAEAARPAAFALPLTVLSLRE